MPLIGSLPFITFKNGSLDWTMDKAVTRHKLATVYLGPRKLFVINDYELAKDLFAREEFQSFILHTGFIAENLNESWNQEKLSAFFV